MPTFGKCPEPFGGHPRPRASLSANPVSPSAISGPSPSRSEAHPRPCGDLPATPVKGYVNFGKGYAPFGKGYATFVSFYAPLGTFHTPSMPSPASSGKGYTTRRKGYATFGKGYATRGKGYASCGKGYEACGKGYESSESSLKKRTKPAAQTYKTRSSVIFFSAPSAPPRETISIINHQFLREVLKIRNHTEITEKAQSLGRTKRLCSFFRKNIILFIINELQRHSFARKMSFHRTGLPKLCASSVSSV